jgi:SOS response associated peptidase (SRAP)
LARTRGDALGPDPHLAKDIKLGFSTFNARAEEIETKPAFHDAFQRRRCLVPLDSFYELKKTGTGKQPYAIAPADRRLMGVAVMGNLALAGRGARAQLYNRHHDAERIVRGTSPPDARGAETPGLASLARRTGCNVASAQGRCWPLPMT